MDLADPAGDLALAGRSWRWLLVRVFGLLNDPTTRLAAALRPKDPEPAGGPHDAERR